jgi:hypothetical protein
VLTCFSLIFAHCVLVSLLARNSLARVLLVIWISSNGRKPDVGFTCGGCEGEGGE